MSNLLHDSHYTVSELTKKLASKLTMPAALNHRGILHGRKALGGAVCRGKHGRFL